MWKRNVSLVTKCDESLSIFNFLQHSHHNRFLTIPMNNRFSYYTFTICVFRFISLTQLAQHSLVQHNLAQHSLAHFYIRFFNSVYLVSWNAFIQSIKYSYTQLNHSVVGSWMCCLQNHTQKRQNLASSTLSLE